MSPWGCLALKDCRRVEFGASPSVYWLALALESKDWSAYAVVWGGGARVQKDLGRAIVFGAHALLSCELILECSST